MTTFISYSRDNSDFAVRLARDLRAAGFDIWLDQLDIRTGARWDDEVEKALEKSTTFLIVLTPESIQSQNVKDEIGYAIDAGKHILPIILRSCNVPFRLRRFQYVDFSNRPYEENFTEIKHLLTNTKELTRVNDDKEDYIPIEKPELKPQPEIAKPPHKWNRQIVIGVLGVIVIVLIVTLPPIFSRQPESPILTPISVSSSQTLTPTALSETLEFSLTVAETVKSPSTSLPAEIVDAQGVEMVLVPAGEFTMGSDNGDSDEKPVHKVYLDSFYIDKYEVTNSLYERCVNVGACQPPTNTQYYDNSSYADHPVTYVNWFMAKKYCESGGARLPTEAEWEKAARGTDGEAYPWGETIDCGYANYRGSNGYCVGKSSSVGSFESGKSFYGIYDMAGNVAEWVSSLNVGYPYNANDGRENLNTSAVRILRGGSWNNKGVFVRSADRAWNAQLESAFDYGFRCAKGINP